MYSTRGARSPAISFLESTTERPPFPHCSPPPLSLACTCKLAKVRERKGQPRGLPDDCRIQLDGVGTNWGKVVFAHIENLVAKGVLGGTTNVVRNPVGSTHEDIDALFAQIRNKLINADCQSIAELKEVILRAFADWKLEIIFVEV